MSDNVLVTGGAGYIGSHVCKALAAAGFVPVVYDNLSTGHAGAVRWGPLVQDDLLDRGALQRVMVEYRPLAVLHFASCVYVGESVEAPARYYRNNVVGALNLLDMARSAGNIPIVFSSSCAVYGIPRTLPITEQEPLLPVNPYGRTKLMIEQMLSDYAVAYGLRSVRLRYFNACGCDPDGEIGESRHPAIRLVPRAVLVAMRLEDELTVFGDDYPTPDGTAVRDYVHVCDLVQAHLAALRMLLSGGGDIALNLGTETGFSVRQVVDAVERVTGLEVRCRIGKRRPGDPAMLVADSSGARRVLGFASRHSDLDTIVRTTHAWFSGAGSADGVEPTST